MPNGFEIGSCELAKMRFHISHICLAFLRCVFSNESSKRLQNRMHSHTGCICLTFPHCALTTNKHNLFQCKINLNLYLLIRFVCVWTDQDIFQSFSNHDFCSVTCIFKRVFNSHSKLNIFHIRCKEGNVTNWSCYSRSALGKTFVVSKKRLQRELSKEPKFDGTIFRQLFV